MVILLPRLPSVAAEGLLSKYIDDEFATWPGFNAHALPNAVRFAATGGSRVHPEQLQALRDDIVQVARSSGMGRKSGRTEHSDFDSAAAAFFADDSLFQSGEALLDDVWSFIGTTLAPDVVHWRFGVARERYLGGIRNAFQRLWIRGVALDRGPKHRKRWQLLNELTEDALVQITERPSLGGDPALATAIAEAWLRASRHHGRRRMEPIMRQAVLRVRVWNETRSLVDLPPKDLVGVLDDAFNITQGRVVANRSATKLAGFSHLSEADVKQSRIERETELDSLKRDVKLIRDKAHEQGWLSRKSSKALSVIAKGERELTSRDRNALKFLLNRMRTNALLQDEVLHLSCVLGS